MTTPLTRIRRLAAVRPAVPLRVGLVALAIFGQGIAVASADCRRPVNQSYLDGLSRNPSVLLQNTGTGDRDLMFRVQMLATASVGSLRDVMRAAPRATPAQKAVIGEGLGRAAGACITRYGDISRRITDAVRRLGDRDVTRAFSAFLLAEDEGAARKPDSPDTGPTGSSGRLNELSVPGSRGLALDDPFKLP